MDPVSPAASTLPHPPGPLFVVGDIICDHYVWGDVERISPEAPVQVLRWESEANRPGGAANVALNMAALGSEVALFGVVGRDAAGEWLLRAVRDAGIDTRGVVQTSDRPTSTKTRVIARGQHLLRIDQESRQELSSNVERQLIASIQRTGRGPVGIVCSDYGKGVLTRPVLTAVFSQANRTRHDAIVLVDPKGRDFGKYRGADLLTPNEKELTEAIPLDGRHEAEGSIERRAETAIRRLGLKALLVTRGANGMDLFEATRGSRGKISRTHIPVSQRHEVFDVTGAGDTVAAVMSMTAASGLPLSEGARLANLAAGIVVESVGTAVTDRETLARVVSGEASQARSKVLSQTALTARLADRRSQGARIVFTNGCFDLLHVGHLHLLQRARALGDVLVVAINDDRSTRRLKGPGRPLVPEAQRAEMLAALRFVDYVTLFSESTPLRLIRALRPDVLVKGGDYAIDQVVGRDAVERRGGRVVLIPTVAGFSTSRLVDLIRQRSAS